MHYPFEEFRDHFQAMKYVAGYEVVARGTDQIEIGPEKCFELNVLRVMDYMSQIYSNPEERMYKGKLLTLIMYYLAEHTQQFDTKDYAVHGSESSGSLIGEHLLKAVHHIFTTRRLQDLGHGPDPKEVMALADTFRKE